MRHVYFSGGKWCYDLTGSVVLSSEDKTELEEMLDSLDGIRDILRRTRRSLPILGTVTDDGCVLWNNGD